MKAELVLGLGIVALFASCSGDDTKKKVAPAMDASVAGSSGGNRPDAGSGGSSAGQPGAGGEAGTPAQPDGGMGGQGMGGEAGTPGLVCDPPDFDAAAGAGGEGGAPLLIGGEWHDFEAEACVACPAAPIACQDLLGPPAPVYDPATRRLTLNLEANHAEIVTATLRIGYSAPDAGNGGMGGMPSLPPSGQAQVDAVVDRNVLTFDLSTQVPEEMIWMEPGWFTVTDTCGVVSETQQSNQGLHVELTDAGGTVVVTECRAWD